MPSILGKMQGWTIVKNTEYDFRKLEDVDSTRYSLEGRPWKPSLDYGFTGGEWILGSSEKRILWLPPHRWSSEILRAWGGRFLAILHRELLEVVVLELPASTSPSPLFFLVGQLNDNAWSIGVHDCSM